VLYLAYATQEALSETLRTRRAVLWSTSRNELWRKGETSGDVLDLVEVRVNCEQNSLLYRVRPRTGGACQGQHREQGKDAGAEPGATCEAVHGRLLHLKSQNPHPNDQIPMAVWFVIWDLGFD
jgi:phosphoribosyl-AMP cyclohydrolase